MPDQLGEEGLSVSASAPFGAWYMLRVHLGKYGNIRNVCCKMMGPVLLSCSLNVSCCY